MNFIKPGFFKSIIAVIVTMALVLSSIGLPGINVKADAASSDIILSDFEAPENFP